MNVGQHNPLRTLHLFAGAGGGILADLALGHRPVCAVEVEPACQAALAARHADGTLPWFPVWSDVRTFDGRPWAGIVDCIAGGFPCTDISVAGKGAGIDGEASGLWREFARIIREVGSRYVFVENSPALATRGLDRVLSDLARMGYNARWCVLGADDAIFGHCDPAFYHGRRRIWILATLPDAASVLTGEIVKRPWVDAVGHCSEAGNGETRGTGKGAPPSPDTPQQHGRINGRKALEPGRVGVSGADADLQRRKKRQPAVAGASQLSAAQRVGWWSAEPGVGGVADGLAARVDIHGATGTACVGRLAPTLPHRRARLKMLGNGQVPAAAAMAWRILTQGDP